MKKILLTCALLFTLGSIVMAINLKPKADYSDANLVNGKERFIKNCVSCHGALGQGDGIDGLDLNEKPANINRKLNSFFTPQSRLINDVLNGEREMPAWKGILSESDITDIFAYVLEINRE